MLDALTPGWLARAVENVDRVLDPYSTKSYAQEGEDLILRRIFNGRRHGFLVDVGAHHPTRFSNSYLLYKLGWRGINIDAMPGSMRAFKRMRPRDINIEAAISDEPRVLTYQMFDDPALNGFDATLSRDVYLPAGYHLVGSAEIRTRTLRELLDQYLPPDQKIDVLSVDVEGLDLQVLRSNDWIRYRPVVILAELLPVSAGRASAETTVEYLAGKDYEIIARTPNTGFFGVRGQSLAQLASPG